MGNFPNMIDAMAEWMGPLTFNLSTTVVSNFQSTETLIPVKFFGVFYPSTPQQIMMKPEGQRQWTWWTLLTSYSLSISDIMIAPDGVKYRVQTKVDYSKAGYYQYELVKDWVR